MPFVNTALPPNVFVAVDGLITGNLDGVGVFADFFIDGFETDV